MKGSRNSTLTNSEKALSIAVNLYALVVFVVLWLLEWIFPALPWMTLYLFYLIYCCVMAWRKMEK